MLLPASPENLVRYDIWANREIASALRRTPAAPPKAVAILAHTVAAQQLWLDRLNRKPQSLPVWPELSYDHIDELLENLARQWNTYLADNARLRADEPVGYINSKGESFQSRPSEILSQIFLHGAYHRGQIALLLRQSDVTPPLTDYIHAVRSGAVSA